MRKFASDQIGALVEKLSRQLESASGDADADAIHDLRVSIRRFNQGLRVFGEFFDAAKAKKLHRRLKKIMDQASLVRDRDIALELLTRSRAAGQTKLRRHLLADREAAHKALVARVEKVSRKWDADLPPANKPSKLWNEEAGPGENARTRLPAQVAEYFQAGRDLVASHPPPPELHKFRLKTKHLRYTLELFRPVYGQAHEKRLSELQGIQQFLGEINDCVAAEKLLPSLKKYLRKLGARRIAAFYKHWKEFSTAGNERSWERGLRIVKKK
jgi:CHAD domain-containing protein